MGGSCIAATTCCELKRINRNGRKVRKGLNAENAEIAEF